MNFDHPKILDCSNFGNPQEGFLSVAEVGNPIPFPIKRLYWVYQNAANRERGDHANLINQQVVICLQGSIKVFLSNKNEQDLEYILNDPSQGLLIPAKHWRRMEFSQDAILLCICSEKYDENDYIKDFNKF